MSAVYETGDKGYITHKGFEVTEETPDEVLFSIGLRRLEIELPEDPNALPTRGPFYRPAEDGTATVTEYHEYMIQDLESLREMKVDLHHTTKHQFMQGGLSYKGHQFDLRIRNICHITMILSLVNNDALPEDFTWYSTDGKLVPMSKKDCMTFIKLVLDKVKEVELKSMQILTKLAAIDNKDELSNFDVKVGSHYDL